MRTFSLKISASLAFALIASQAFAHAQLEKASPPVGGTVASASEIRLTFSEGVELKFTKVSADRSGRGRAARGGENGIGRPGRADRADHERARGRRVQSSLAGGVGRHAPHAGNFRIHGEAMTAAAAPGGEQSERTDHETFSFHPGAGFRHKRCACAGAGVQSRRHRDRKPLGARNPEGRQVGGGYLTIRQQRRDARPADRRNGGFRHGRSPSDDVQERRDGDAGG